MKSQVLHTVWCNISGEAAGEIWNWSLLGVKGLTAIQHYSYSFPGSSSRYSSVFLWREKTARVSSRNTLICFFFVAFRAVPFFDTSLSCHYAVIRLSQQRTHCTVTAKELCWRFVLSTRQSNQLDQSAISWHAKHWFVTVAAKTFRDSATKRNSKFNCLASKLVVH